MPVNRTMNHNGHRIDLWSDRYSVDGGPVMPLSGASLDAVLAMVDEIDRTTQRKMRSAFGYRG